MSLVLLPLPLLFWRLSSIELEFEVEVEVEVEVRVWEAPSFSQV